MKRSFDLLVCLILALPAAVIVAVASALIYLEDRHNAIYTQCRLGKGKSPFTIYKLRTMRAGTPTTTTHRIGNDRLTAVGSWLRRTKIDELPQLYNVLLGNMSLVGPRPGLVNHDELTEARDAHGVFAVRPGITGLSQIRKIDMSEPQRLAQSDAEYIRNQSFFGDLAILFATISGRGSGDGVRI